MLINKKIKKISSLDRETVFEYVRQSALLMHLPDNEHVLKCPNSCNSLPDEKNVQSLATFGASALKNSARKYSGKTS